MRTALEAVVFGALALGLHLALFAAVPTGGSAASGAGGDSTVTLSGAAPALAETVAAWQRAPDAAPTAAMQRPPAPSSSPPAAAPAPTGRLPIPSLARPAPPVTLAPPAPAETSRPESLVAPPAPPAPSRPRPRPERTPEPAAPQREPADERTPADPPPPSRAPADGGAQRGAEQGAEREARPTAEPSPAGRVARGAGAGAQAGTGGGDPNAGPGPAEYRSLMARWGGGIRAAIERSLRPAGGPGGTTRLRLTVTADGRLAGAAIAASSGHAALDRAALAAVRAARYPPAPRGLPPGSYTFTLPLTQR